MRCPSCGEEITKIDEQLVRPAGNNKFYHARCLFICPGCGELRAEDSERPCILCRERGIDIDRR